MEGEAVVAGGVVLRRGGRDAGAEEQEWVVEQRFEEIVAWEPDQKEDTRRGIKDAKQWMEIARALHSS